MILIVAKILVIAMLALSLQPLQGMEDHSWRKPSSKQCCLCKEVIRPNDSARLYHRHKHLRTFACPVDGCQELLLSKNLLKKHCNEKHVWSERIRKIIDERIQKSQLLLQTITFVDIYDTDSPKPVAQVSPLPTRSVALPSYETVRDTVALLTQDADYRRNIVTIANRISHTPPEELQSLLSNKRKQEENHTSSSTKRPRITVK